MIKEFWNYIFYDNIVVDRVEWNGDKITLECTYFPKAIKILFKPRVSLEDISFRTIYRYNVPENIWYEKLLGDKQGQIEVKDERLLRTLMSIFIDFMDCSKLTHAMFIELNQDSFK